jgi:dTDP-glucose 4,6-dehydratase
MSRLLITGGCGFIGSNFINYIFKQKPDITIVNIDAMYYCADENNITEEVRNSGRYHLVKGNLCSLDLLNHVLPVYDIDSVIHFAAQSHVDNSFTNSLKYTHDNVLGTHTLLEACRIWGKIKRFIHVSTDEIYGESSAEDEAHQKKTEKSVFMPTNPYAGSKAAAELIVNSYKESFKMPIIITRGNNVYGPNQYPEKLIPRFIKLLKEDKKLTIQGDGSNIRAFLHTEDVVRAFEIIFEKGIIGEIYNIGSDEHTEYTVMQIAQILIKLVKNTDKYEDYIEFVEDRPFNDKRYYISNDKIKKLGWNIEKDFIEGLTELI